jgi:hypothetical protein
MLVAAYQKRASLYHTHLKDKEKVALELVRISRIYYNLGIDSYKAEAYQQCTDHLDSSIRWFRNDSETFYQRAICKIGSGNQSGAKDDFIAAARLGHQEAQKLLSAKQISY